MMSVHSIRNIFLSLILLFAGAGSVRAFDNSAYTESSVLASGRWVKVGVETDGLYMIPASTLRAWGFSDFSRVRIFGYGGHRLTDDLSADKYIDDLPLVQTVTTDRGIVFYGLGANETVTERSGAIYIKQNDYSQYGYYFVGLVSDTVPVRDIPATAIAGATDATTTFTAVSHHELELLSVTGEAGPLLLGEDFRYTRSHRITMATPGAVGGRATLRGSFFATITGRDGSVAYTVDGETTAPASNRVPVKSNSMYVHGTLPTHANTFTMPKGKSSVSVGVTFTPGGTCTGAWLNSLTLNYEAELKLPSSGWLAFDSGATYLELAGASEGVTVWDVTDAANVKAVNVSLTGDKASWTANFSGSGKRRYVAWNRGSSLPAPKAAWSVTNQNLHGDSDLDMVIVAPAAFVAQARRLADLHATSSDSLKVKVVDIEHIYNEFSSGTPDPGAMRRYFKMLYDRGNNGVGRPLRYATLMGRTTIDNRGLGMSAPSYPTIPSWMPSAETASLSDNDGYCTDDITAMLDDGSGTAIARDKLSIAIGRIPVVSESEAQSVVDKLVQYDRNARKSAWKHRFMFLADDQDNGVHLRQTEQMVTNIVNTEGQQHLLRKVYMDAYKFVGSNFPEARETMFRYLDEGVVWWNFIGHANTTGWTHENQLSYSDLNSMYLRFWPFIYAATCDFLRIDGNSITGGEILFKERYGGAIGIISAVRPVYISDNAYLSYAMGRALAQRDATGRLLAPGEVYRRAKNDIRNLLDRPLADENRLRYVFIGDPALRLAMPSNIVRVDSIGDEPVGGDSQPVMAALARVPVSGTVTDALGNELTGFNGVVNIEILDAERSRTTLGNGGESGSIETFEDYGERVYTGSAEVRNGRFSLVVSMPSELSQNFREATMSLYAYATDTDDEAVGLFRDFYVYGYDETVEPDTKAPEIETMVLNHSSFKSGDAVNSSPMLIATVRDDVGINVSNAGIGHQLTATLDGNKPYTDVSFYYTPSADGTPSGVINYPFSDLLPGNHTLSLKVWDTTGNSATRDIDFFVQESVAPKIYDIYTDANPASVQANFYLSHDQPDNMVTVNVTVYNLLGKPVWSGGSTGRSDMFLSVPVSWDLTDEGGRRVPRGIYIYRATISSDGISYETASRRLAVTAQ